MSAAISATVGLSQQQHQCEIEADQSERHFTEAQRLAQQLASDAFARKAHLYSEEAELEYKLARKLRLQALDVARRECNRDSWQAADGHIQASLFVATVLIGFGYEILSGAVVSEAWQREQPVWLTLFFFFTVASIALGLAAVAFLLVRHRRMAEFDAADAAAMKLYACGHRHENTDEYILCRCKLLEAWTHWALIASVVSGSAAVMIYAFDKFQSASSQQQHQQEIFSQIRMLASPVVFCLIVGCSVGAMLVIDFAYGDVTLPRELTNFQSVSSEEEQEDEYNSQGFSDNGSGGEAFSTSPGTDAGAVEMTSGTGRSSSRNADFATTSSRASCSSWRSG